MLVKTPSHTLSLVDSSCVSKADWEVEAMVWPNYPFSVIMNTFVMEFISPTAGKLSFDQMFQELVKYVEEDTNHLYNLIIGTDSMLNDETTFVTAIVVHRVGHGGRYFYRKVKDRKMESLRQRMFHEASLSLEAASHLTAELGRNGYAKLPVAIHLDVGENGETKEIIREVVGMVTGSGYAAVVKPDAYGATKVADRHSK